MYAAHDQVNISVASLFFGLLLIIDSYICSTGGKLWDKKIKFILKYKLIISAPKWAGFVTENVKKLISRLNFACFTYQSMQKKFLRTLILDIIFVLTIWLKTPF